MRKKRRLRRCSVKFLLQNPSFRKPSSFSGRSVSIDANVEDRVLSPGRELDRAVAGKAGCRHPVDRHYGPRSSGIHSQTFESCATSQSVSTTSTSTTRRRLGILVTNTPGVLTETTADFAWTLLMAAARRVVEGDSFARSGQWKAWGLQMLLGHDVFGKTLGIVGFGRIGQAVARRAMGFNMSIQYFDSQPVPPGAVPEGVKAVSLETLFCYIRFHFRPRARCFRKQHTF